MGRLISFYDGEGAIKGHEKEFCYEICKEIDDCKLCSIQKIFNKLGTYEDIIDDPEKLKLIDELYLERCEEINKLKAELAEYKKLEEQGLLLRLPYTLETKKLYFADDDSNDVYELSATTLCVSMEKGKTVYEYDCFRFYLEHFGKTVFLTQEEAEQALERMKEVQNVN